MKHTWVTGLSVFGVLGAGSAAVLANTTVFNNTAKSGGAISMSATTLSSSSPTTPATMPDIRGGNPTTTVATTVPMAQTYAIGNSGTVQLSNVNGVITIDSALASPGWTVNSSSAPGSWVVVEFLGADQRVVFNAYLVDGSVQVSVDTSTQPGSPVSPQVTQPGPVLTLPPGVGSDDGHPGTDVDD